jgi:putative transposase
MKFQFIKDHRKDFSITLMCKVLEVSHSGYYAWQVRPESKQKMANQQLAEKIKAIFHDTDETYGSPRICKELNDQGESCSENRVARIMRENGIRAKQTRKYKTTTKANNAHSVAPNLLNRDFSADRPNQKWVTDITYIDTQEGWLYLAGVMDLFSRRIVGWSMSKRMTSALVVDALKMAISQRNPPPGLIHHSDRGSQYTGRVYQQLLKDNQMMVSMSGTGNCYDNAVMESFFGTLKKEHVHHCIYRIRDEAKADLFFYIEAFYNRRRRHSTLGYISPLAFEQAHYQHVSTCLTLCPQK